MLGYLLFFSALLSGLIAGLFYSYSCSVNPGLGRLSDREYLRAMQSINKAILNPVFFISFLGTLIAIPATAVVYWNTNGFDLSCALLIVSALIYGIGVFGVTIRANVPLNDMLDKLDLSAGAGHFAKWRSEFEQPWNRYHSLRTVLNVVTFILVIAVLIINFKPAV